MFKNKYFEENLVLDRDKRKVEAGKFSHLSTPEATRVDHPGVAKMAFLLPTIGSDFTVAPIGGHRSKPSVHIPASSHPGVKTKHLGERRTHFQVLKLEHSCSYSK